MIRIIFIILVLILVGCNSNSEEDIAELFKRVNNNRISGKKKAAIKDCENIISIDKTNIDAHRVLSELTFETGNFKRSLQLNKKLIELNPDAYQYYSKTGLLLAVFDKNEESEFYYEKARKVFSKNEQKYWSKTDTLNMASMLMTIGDSIRSRKLIKSMINRNPEDSFNIIALKEFTDYSHIKKVNRLKKVMNEAHYTESDDNNSASKIIEVKN